MKPVATFQAQPRHFWAHVKLLSEGLGYSAGGILKRYKLSDLQKFLTSYGLSANHLDQPIDTNATYGSLVIGYISYRADVLEKSVEANLMNKEQALEGPNFNHNPQGLIVVTDAVKPLRMFSRRMDGAFPSIVNPLAVWEIKEYYGSTTFGSRIADGVYETMLDGEEFAELQEHEMREVKR